MQLLSLIKIRKIRKFITKYNSIVPKKFQISYCAKCEKLKLRSKFNRDNRSSIGVHYYCKKCRSEYRKNNQNNINEYYKEWCRKNPEALERYKENKNEFTKLD